MQIFDKIDWPGGSGIVEILVLAALFYYAILFLRGTRGAQVLSGFVIALILLTVLTQVFHLNALNWMLEKISVYFAVALVIIFQPEIRRALAELGRQHVFQISRSERHAVEQIVHAMLSLAERKIGAIIAIQREATLGAVIETGVRLDSRVTPELLNTIFFPNTALHDGGVVVVGDRIVAASCIFPLSQQTKLSKALGTRHRAAVGLSEESDAIVLVVSEETGTISVAVRGKLRRGVDEEHLRRILTQLLLRAKRDQGRLERVGNKLDLSPSGVARTEDAQLDEEQANG